MQEEVCEVGDGDDGYFRDAILFYWIEVNKNELSTKFRVTCKRCFDFLYFLYLIYTL